MTLVSFFGLLIHMSARKASVSESQSKKPFRPNQTQILYTLLLVAVFLVGYLLATVQLLRNPVGTTLTQQPTDSAAVGAGQEAPPTPVPETVIAKLEEVQKEAPSGGKLKGDPNAKVKIVEFSDLECPFCARFYSDTLPQIISDYIDTGKASLEYRHYPLPFHPQAKPLAIATECANDQGKFWEMHDKIFEENIAGALAGATPDTYKQWAADIGLSTADFNSCYDAETHTDVVDSDTNLGGTLGVSGTPTFYINGRQLVGAQPFASFQAIIDEELSK